jgi:hypothetical protein
VRERKELVTNAGTTVEGTADHAFGTVLFTFNEVVEGDPVFILEEVSELEVTLFVADIDFGVVFVDNRVQFLTDRNVKVRAIANEGKEGKCQGQTHAALHTLILDRLGKAKNRKGNQANERDFDKSGHHVNHGAKERTRNPDRNAFHNLLGFGHKEQNEHGRHGKHRVEVSTHAEERDVADKDENAVAVIFVTLVVPNETEIRH